LRKWKAIRDQIPHAAKPPSNPNNLTTAKIKIICTQNCHPIDDDVVFTTGDSWPLLMIALADAKTKRWQYAIRLSELLAVFPIFYFKL
jgi:hypothetical protein